MSHHNITHITQTYTRNKIDLLLEISCGFEIYGVMLFHPQLIHCYPLFVPCHNLLITAISFYIPRRLKIPQIIDTFIIQTEIN